MELAVMNPIIKIGGTHTFGHQGHHGCQSRQGLGLAWILQNRKRQRHAAADVATTVAALPIENWPWLPWIIPTK